MKNKKVPIISKLFPEEFFGFIMLTVFLVLSFIFKEDLKLDRITGRHYFMFFTYTVLLFLIFKGKFKNIFKLIRNFFPLILVTTVFENLGDIVTLLNPHHADAALIRIDKFLFGGDVSIWMQQFYTPWLSNIMHSAYTSYYFLPPLVGMLLYLSGEYKIFRNFVVAVTFTAFIGYIGYVLVPAIGPKYTLAHLYTQDLKTGQIMTKLAEIINNYEPFRTDCFPSLHTAHSLVAMIFSYKYLRKYLSIPLCILGTLLIISTIYGRHHYTIDVIAGIILALFTYKTAEIINKFWYSKIFDSEWISHYPLSNRGEWLRKIIFKKND